jgi:sarcosine oxidase delta subunit
MAVNRMWKQADGQMDVQLKWVIYVYASSRMPSSGIWCHMAVIRTYVSEERNAFSIRVKRVSKIGKRYQYLATEARWQNISQLSWTASYC